MSLQAGWGACMPTMLSCEQGTIGSSGCCTLLHLAFSEAALRCTVRGCTQPPAPPQLGDDGSKVGAPRGVLVPAALHHLDPCGQAGEGAGAGQLAVGRWLGNGRAVAAHDLAHDLCRCMRRGAAARIINSCAADVSLLQLFTHMPRNSVHTHAVQGCWRRFGQVPPNSPSRSVRCPRAAARSSAAAGAGGRVCTRK